MFEDELKPLPLFSGILSHVGDVVVEYEKGRTAIGMTAAVVKRTLRFGSVIHRLAILPVELFTTACCYGAIPASPLQRRDAF